jgi:ADP-ribose pyrophosphatase
VPERPWRVLEARTLHADPFGVVEVHDVETPDGRAFAFPLVRTRGYVKVLPVTPDGQVIFVRQYRHPLGRVLLELPAGGIDPGETPEEAAVRELAEEALVRPAALEPLGTFATSPGRMEETGTLFLATGCVEDPEAVQHEPTLPVRVSIDEALAAVGRDLEDATSALALLLARERLLALRVAPSDLG